MSKLAAVPGSVKRSAGCDAVLALEALDSDGVTTVSVHKSTKTQVAIKVMQLGLRSVRHQLYKELQAYSKLRSNHIVQYYGAFFDKQAIDVLAHNARWSGAVQFVHVSVSPVRFMD